MQKEGNANRAGKRKMKTLERYAFVSRGNQAPPHIARSVVIDVGGREEEETV